MVCVRKEGITFVLVFGLFIIKRNEALSSHESSPFAAAFSNIFNNINSNDSNNRVEFVNPTTPRSFMDIFSTNDTPMVLVKKKNKVPEHQVEDRDSFGANRVTRWPPPRAEVGSSASTTEAPWRKARTTPKNFIPKQIKVSVSSRGDNQIEDKTKLFPILVTPRADTKNSKEEVEIVPDKISERSYSYEPPSENSPRLNYDRENKNSFDHKNMPEYSSDKPSSMSYQTFTIGTDETTTPVSVFDDVVYHDDSSRDNNNVADSYGSPLAEVQRERPPSVVVANQDFGVSRLPIETLFQSSAAKNGGYAGTPKPFLPPQPTMSPFPGSRGASGLSSQQQHPEFIPVMIMVRNPAFFQDHSLPTYSDAPSSVNNIQNEYAAPSPRVNLPSAGSPIEGPQASYTSMSDLPSSQSSYSPSSSSTRSRVPARRPATSYTSSGATINNILPLAQTPISGPQISYSSPASGSRQPSYSSTDPTTSLATLLPPTTSYSPPPAAVPTSSYLPPAAQETSTYADTADDALRKPSGQSPRASSQDGYGTPLSPVLRSNNNPSDTTTRRAQNPFLTTETSTSTSTSAYIPPATTSNEIPNYSRARVKSNSNRARMRNLIPTSYRAPRPPSTTKLAPATETSTSYSAPSTSYSAPSTSYSAPSTTSSSTFTRSRSSSIPSTSTYSTSTSTSSESSSSAETLASSTSTEAATEGSISARKSDTDSGLKVKFRNGDPDGGVEQSINLNINVIVKGHKDIEEATAEIKNDNDQENVVSANVAPTLIRRKVQTISSGGGSGGNSQVPRTVVSNSASPAISSTGTVVPSGLPSYNPQDNNSHSVLPRPAVTSNNVPVVTNTQVDMSNLPVYGGQGGQGTSVNTVSNTRVVNSDSRPFVSNLPTYNSSPQSVATAQSPPTSYVSSIQSVPTAQSPSSIYNRPQQGDQNVQSPLLSYNNSPQSVQTVQSSLPSYNGQSGGTFVQDQSSVTFTSPGQEPVSSYQSPGATPTPSSPTVTSAPSRPAVVTTATTAAPAISTPLTTYSPNPPTVSTTTAVPTVSTTVTPVISTPLPTYQAPSVQVSSGYDSPNIIPNPVQSTTSAPPQSYSVTSSPTLPTYSTTQSPVPSTTSRPVQTYNAISNPTQGYSVVSQPQPQAPIFRNTPSRPQRPRYMVRKRKRPRKRPSITFQDQLGPTYKPMSINHYGTPRPTTTSNPNKQRSPTTPSGGSSYSRAPPTGAAFKALLANAGGSYQPPQQPVQNVQQIAHQPVQPVSTTYSTRPTVTTTPATVPKPAPYVSTTISNQDPSTQIKTPYEATTAEYDAPNVLIDEYYEDALESLYAYDYNEADIYQLYTYDDDDEGVSYQNENVGGSKVVGGDHVKNIASNYPSPPSPIPSPTPSYAVKETFGGGGDRGTKSELLPGENNKNYFHHNSQGQGLRNPTAAGVGVNYNKDSYGVPAADPVKSTVTKSNTRYQAKKRPRKKRPRILKNRPAQSYTTIRTPSYSYSTSNEQQSYGGETVKANLFNDFVTKLKYKPPTPKPHRRPTSTYRQPTITTQKPTHRPKPKPTYLPPTRYHKPHHNQKHKQHQHPREYYHLEDHFKEFHFKDEDIDYENDPYEDVHHEKDSYKSYHNKHLHDSYLKHQQHKHSYHHHYPKHHYHYETKEEEWVPEVEEVAKNSDWDVMDFTDWAKRIPSPPEKDLYHNYEYEPRHPRYYGHFEKEEIKEETPLPVISNPFGDEVPSFSLREIHPDTTTAFDELIRYKKPRRYLPVKLLQNRKDDTTQIKGKVDNDEKIELIKEKVVAEEEVKLDDVDKDSHQHLTGRDRIKTTEFDIGFEDWLGKFGVERGTLGKVEKGAAGNKMSKLLAEPKKRKRRREIETLDIDERGVSELKGKIGRKIASEIGRFKDREYFSEKGEKYDDNVADSDSLVKNAVGAMLSVFGSLVKFGR